MMRPGPTDRKPKESGVATMIEYVMISAILMALLVVMLLLTNTSFMEAPLTTITYTAFTDIGNGVSTRMVDVYAIEPDTGEISSQFDIPDDVGGRGYFVEVLGDTSGQTIRVSRDSILSTTELAGIGASSHGQAGGNTTGSGMNTIGYCSAGYDSNGDCIL
jgi:hypothetical protein